MTGERFITFSESAFMHAGTETENLTALKTNESVKTC